MRGYRTRKVGGRGYYKVLVIVCERETEVKYFNRYRKRGCGLKIETPNTSVTDPINLVEFAKRQIQRYGLNLQKDDHIWVVFDCDHNKAEAITKAIKIANENNINFAISNPSFELWFLLHFVYHHSKLTNQELIEKLKTHIPNYKKSKDVFDVLLKKREEAISNAKKLNESQNNNEKEIIKNPSTHVFKLVELILEKITN